MTDIARDPPRPALAITDFLALMTACTVVVAFHQQYTWLAALKVSLVGGLASPIPVESMLATLKNSTTRRMLTESLGRIYSALVLAGLLMLVSVVVGIILVFARVVDLPAIGEIVRYGTLAGLVAGFTYSPAGFKVRKLTCMAYMLCLGSPSAIPGEWVGCSTDNQDAKGDEQTKAPKS